MSAPGSRLGALLLLALLALAVGAFAVTRVARSGDDLVNTVELSPKLRPGGDAEVSFTLAEPDGAVDVLIIEGDPGADDEQVRALELDADLDAGPQTFTWDGTTDEGGTAPAGLYALRVVLGEAERDILPPGRIEVVEEP